MIKNEGKTREQKKPRAQHEKEHKPRRSKRPPERRKSSQRGGEVARHELRRQDPPPQKDGSPRLNGKRKHKKPCSPGVTKRLDGRAAGTNATEKLRPLRKT